MGGDCGDGVRRHELVDGRPEELSADEEVEGARGFWGREGRRHGGVPRERAALTSFDRASLENEESTAKTPVGTSRPGILVTKLTAASI
jgi:hypothetical protein